jgi:hypothetical protein
MLSLKLEYDMPEDRSLHIQLSKEIQPGRHEIVLVVDKAGEMEEISPSEQLADFAGSLSWPEEPLEYQKRLREEWP